MDNNRNGVGGRTPCGQNYSGTNKMSRNRSRRRRGGRPKDAQKQLKNLPKRGTNNVVEGFEKFRDVQAQDKRSCYLYNHDNSSYCVNYTPQNGTSFVDVNSKFDAIDSPSTSCTTRNELSACSRSSPLPHKSKLTAFSSSKSIGSPRLNAPITNTNCKKFQLNKKLVELPKNPFRSITADVSNVHTKNGRENTLQRNTKSSKSSDESNEKSEKNCVNSIGESSVKDDSEEDVICLGRLEKQFVVEDDEELSTKIDNEICDHANTAVDVDNCLICEKEGHSSIQCQMICKNCSNPYHNLKTCPEAPNLSIMMQTFMEFCMQQLSRFNPGEKFKFPENICTKSRHISNPNGMEKTGKTPYEKKSACNNVGGVKKANITTNSATSATYSENNSGAKMGSESTVSAHGNVFLPHTSFPPFAGFPGFAPNAAVYNPMVYSQMIQNLYPRMQH